MSIEDLACVTENFKYFHLLTCSWKVIERVPIFIYHCRFSMEHTLYSFWKAMGMKPVA